MRVEKYHPSSNTLNRFNTNHEENRKGNDHDDVLKRKILEILEDYKQKVITESQAVERLTNLLKKEQVQPTTEKNQFDIRI